MKNTFKILRKPWIMRKAWSRLDLFLMLRIQASRMLSKISIECISNKIKGKVYCKEMNRQLRLTHCPWPEEVWITPNKTWWDQLQVLEFNLDPKHLWLFHQCLRIITIKIKIKHSPQWEDNLRSTIKMNHHNRSTIKCLNKINQENKGK